jgi:hypothetical protein
LDNIKNAFVDNFVNYLTKPLNNNNESNSICLYSKIPFIINCKNKLNKNYKKVASYVFIKKNESIIADPLTIIHRNIVSNEIS